MRFSFGNQPMTIPVILSLLILGCAGQPPAAIGISDGRLAPCPDRPNCVSSMVSDEARHVAPFTYASSDRQAAFDALLRVLSAEKRAAITARTDDYLHVEFKSKWFGFVDDVEFYFPDDEPVIHVRSASRVGYSDLGVNRKRVSHLRKQFAEALKKR